MAKRKNMAENRQLNIRTFVQLGGARPGNPVQYLNKGKGQFRTGALTPPVAGSNTVYRPSDDYYGRFQPLGQTETQPEQGTLALSQDLVAKQRNLLEKAQKRNQSLGVHVVLAEDGVAVGEPDNWLSKFVFPYTSITGLPLSDLQGADSDEIVTWNAELGFTEWDRVVRGTFQEVAGTLIGKPVAGVTFGKDWDYRYAVTQGDGVAALPEVIYKSGKNAAWAEANISVLAATENPTGLTYIGQYLIAPTAANSYIYAHEDTPSAWSEVSAGFVATKIPNAVYAATLVRTFFAANGGYIYLMPSLGAAVTVVTDGTLTTQDLKDIDGLGDTIVAVGGNGAVLASRNGGETFTLKTAPAAVVLNRIAVLDDDNWIAGGANGNIYYTEDAGVTWNTGSFPGAGSGSVGELVFQKTNSAFGLLMHNTGTAVKVYRTTDGGNRWEQTTLTGYPSSLSGAAAALWDPNIIIASGTATGGTDGILAIAED